MSNCVENMCFDTKGIVNLLSAICFINILHIYSRYLRILYRFMAHIVYRNADEKKLKKNAE